MKTSSDSLRHEKWGLRFVEHKVWGIICGSPKINIFRSFMPAIILLCTHVLHTEHTTGVGLLSFSIAYICISTPEKLVLILIKAEQTLLWNACWVTMYFVRSTQNAHIQKTKSTSKSNECKWRWDTVRKLRITN